MSTTHESSTPPASQQVAQDMGLPMPPLKPENRPAEGASVTVAKQCSCGNDLNHPRVTAEPKYGLFASLLFLLGISAPVKEVVFWCEMCGTVMKRSRDPEVLKQYRWHTS